MILDAGIIHTPFGIVRVACEPWGRCAGMSSHSGVEGPATSIYPTAPDAASVAIAIYNGGGLAMRIHVLDHQFNGAFDEAWFVVPE